MWTEAGEWRRELEGGVGLSGGESGWRTTWDRLCVYEEGEGEHTHPLFYKE